MDMEPTSAANKQILPWDESVARFRMPAADSTCMWRHLVTRNTHGELSRGRDVITGAVKMEFERLFSHSLSPACLAPL
jgi:hypothetical protein